MQMASYGLGYPVVVGCHNTHRVTALKQVGGFAPHDADDVLLTLFYRAAGWQGVYVPEILARGLTPVDWSGYLGQQQRWARSVLDIKFRQYFKLYDNLPFQARVISFLHGFNYLYKNFLSFIVLIYIAVMLASGITPHILRSESMSILVQFAVILWLCDLYRQRFYLDPRREMGLHWRAVLLFLAKWPYGLLAFYEVIINRRLPYILTVKVNIEPQRYKLMWPHLLLTILIATSWIYGVVAGRTNNFFLHVVATVVIMGLVALIATELFAHPAPFDDNIEV
jgi:cellulose synthase/poly-beta-1,6-N-acetylglucosamine synthase-like glycosyltransferase